MSIFLVSVSKRPMTIDDFSFLMIHHPLYKGEELEGEIKYSHTTYGELNVTLFQLDQSPQHMEENSDLPIVLVFNESEVPHDDFEEERENYHPVIAAVVADMATLSDSEPEVEEFLGLNGNYTINMIGVNLEALAQRILESEQDAENEAPKPTIH